MLKLQINSTEALQKLIAEDENFGIEVKSAVLNKLAKTYVKSLERSEVLPIIKDVLDETLFDKSDVSYQTYIRHYLNTQVRSLIRETIIDEIRTVIREEFNEAHDEIHNFIAQKAGELVPRLFPVSLATTYSNEIRAKVKEIFDLSKEEIDGGEIGKEFNELKNKVLKKDDDRN
jgi:hypothetical protein